MKQILLLIYFDLPNQIKITGFWGFGVLGFGVNSCKT